MNDRVLVAKMIAHIEQNLLEPVTAAGTERVSAQASTH